MPTPNPVVTQVLAFTRIIRDAADRALDAVSARAAANPADNATQLDFRQGVQAHAAVLLACSNMLTAAIGIVADDATQNLAPITNATNQLAGVVNRISSLQRAADVLADLVTTATDIVAAVTTLNPAKILAAAGDVQTVVQDTIGTGG